MVTLIVAFLMLGFSALAIWFLGFSQEEVGNLEEIANNGNVVVVAEDQDGVEESETAVNSTIKSTNDKTRGEESYYAQMWGYPVKYKTNFRWPQEAATLVSIQRRREGATQLSMELRMKLESMGILREESRDQQQQVTENIAEIARTTGILMPRSKLWVTFDTFAAKNRPGLAQSSEDEEGGAVNRASKKKKKSEETAMKNIEIMKWKNKHTDLFQQEKENLIKFVKGEKSGFVRSI